MVFNWHASLRMPGSEPSFSLECQGFPTQGHNRKARVLMFPPLHTSHRLMLQEYIARALNMDMDVPVSYLQACIRLFQTRNGPGVLPSTLFTGFNQRSLSMALSRAL